MKLMHVFDYNDFPRDLYSRMLRYYEHAGNGCYVTVYMDEYYEVMKAENPVAEWLTHISSDSTMFDVCAYLVDTFGVTDDTVMVSHSW